MTFAALGRLLWCFMAHSRFAIWTERGDIFCQRCRRIVWRDAASSRQYEQMYGSRKESA